MSRAIRSKPRRAGLDIEQVNQQSLRLTRLTMFGVFRWRCTGVVGPDLGGLLPTTSPSTNTPPAAARTLTTAAISLNNLLGALLIIAITVAARNLPGLLEVMVLSKLRLAQGSAYATTTLLSYALAGFGIVATLSTLGVSWDKLQWLVAALGGPGFRPAGDLRQLHFRPDHPLRAPGADR